jgi:hypothetical protein
VLDLVLQRFLEKADNVGIQLACHPHLSSVNANGSMLSGMIDLQDSGRCPTVNRVHLHFSY